MLPLIIAANELDEKELIRVVGEMMGMKVVHLDGPAGDPLPDAAPFRTSGNIICSSREVYEKDFVEALQVVFEDDQRAGRQPPAPPKEMAERLFELLIRTAITGTRIPMHTLPQACKVAQDIGMATPDEFWAFCKACAKGDVAHSRPAAPAQPQPKQAEETQTATVHSSHGDILINARTGEVLGFDLDTSDRQAAIDLLDITRFDLDEYADCYGKLDSEYDILDLGYTTAAGVTERAEPDFRRRVAEQLGQVAAEG